MTVSELYLACINITPDTLISGKSGDNVFIEKKAKHVVDLWGDKTVIGFYMCSDGEIEICIK